MSIREVDNWPRIVEIGWILTDKLGNELEAATIILKPDGFIIPHNVSAIHGITDDIANEKGKDRITVLNQFAALLGKAKILIAHNIAFDKKVVHAELMRYNIKSPIHNISKLCTKELTTDYCKLTGKYGYKWPTLEELYDKIFKTKLSSRHSVFGDVKACKDCFFELINRGVIKLYGSNVLVDTVFEEDDNGIIQIDEIKDEITDDGDYQYFTIVRHLGLKDERFLKAKDEWILEERVEKQIERFNAKWEKAKPKLKNHFLIQSHILKAEERTNEANNQIKQFETILEQSIKKLKNKVDLNANISKIKSECHQNDPYLIVRNCDLVLSISEYPDVFPKTYEIGYNPVTQLLLVDYCLPSIEALPKVKSVKYNKTENIFKSTNISQRKINTLYSDVVFQVAIRTVYELFMADYDNAIKNICFNGYVLSNNKQYIVSFVADKKSFLKISFKGLSCMNLVNQYNGKFKAKLSSIVPLIRFDNYCEKIVYLSNARS